MQVKGVNGDLLYIISSIIYLRLPFCPVFDICLLIFLLPHHENRKLYKYVLTMYYIESTKR